ncbi:MAG: hypothetical protein ACLP22_26240 [Solirubrobacteraceae bacterium]
MIYVLLILPHIAMIAGLLAFAYYSHHAVVHDDDDGSTYGSRGEESPPRAPQPVPSCGGLPLSESAPPRRRLRVGERLSELYPRRLRREHAPAPREPARN